MTLTALAADGFQQHVSHSARPPQLHCPAPCRGVLQLRFLGLAFALHIQFTAKKQLCKERFGNFSLVFSSAKKLSKILCSFDIHFLFKYDLSEL